MEVVGPEVWPVGATEPWLVMLLGSWVVVVTEPEVEAVVAIVLEIWVVAVIGPLAVVAEH